MIHEPYTLLSQAGLRALVAAIHYLEDWERVHTIIPDFYGEHAHTVTLFALLFLRGQYVLWERVGKTIQRKGVSPETLYTAFVAEPVDSGWLSPDIMRCGIGPAGAFAVKFIPASVQTLRFDSGDRHHPLVVTAPLPPLVFAGVNVAAEGKHATYYLWALQDERFTPQAKLFYAPLPNVYDEGRICWGENFPPEAGRSTIDEAWRLFINSLFTGEMGGDRSERYPRDVRGLFLSLEGTPTYPVQDLQPLTLSKRTLHVTSSTVTTVSDAVDKYILREEQQS